MGSAASSSSLSALHKGQVVSSAALRRELERYAGPKHELSKAKLKTFLRDVASLLGFPPPDDLIAALDFDERISFPVELCVKLFVDAAPKDLLSESLRDCEKTPMEEQVRAVAAVEPVEGKKKGWAMDVFENTEVQSSTSIEPRVDGKYCPPGLYFAREWSLVFMRKGLKKKKKKKKNDRINPDF